MDLKKIVFILFIIGFLTMGAVSAEVKTTVDGVDFVLDDSTIIFFEDETSTYFEIGNGLGGLIESVDDDYVKYSIINNTDSNFYVKKANNPRDVVDTYAFVNGYESEGYFQFFKKDNKQFIFSIFNPNGWDDNAKEEMVDLLFKFDSDNKGIKPI